MQVDIKSAALNDQNVWLPMRSLLWPQSSEKEHLKELEELIHSGSFSAWLVFHGEKPIGFAEVSIRPYVNGCNSRPVPFLEGVWIEPGYRKQGIGKQLIQFISNWAQRRGFTELGSDVEIENRDSVEAHQRWGFEETERVIYFRKDLVAAGEMKA